MERFGFVFLVAGLGFFILAFIVSAWLPWLPFTEEDFSKGYKTVAQLAKNPPLEFLELREQYPAAFEKAFPNMSDSDAFAQALEVGHKIYIGEACWHCHSQQIRPVGGDEARFGRISYPEEYNNELNYPPLWGTRRIGPDLIRAGGQRSNDWHVAHFWNPPDVSPTSVMPRYPWFFEHNDSTTKEDESVMPNKKGLSIIAYIQWLGSWQTNPRETLHEINAIERAHAAPARTTNGAPAPAKPDPAVTPEKKKTDEDY